RSMPTESCSRQARRRTYCRVFSGDGQPNGKSRASAVGLAWRCEPTGQRHLAAGPTTSMAALDGVTVPLEVPVDWPRAEWESRCEQALHRRPFRLHGGSDPAADGRAFVASYHRFGVVVEIIVDVVRIDANHSLLSVEGIPLQDTRSGS